MLENERGQLQHFDLQARVDVLVQVAEAIAYLHKNDIRHWDIKPANILLDNDLLQFLAVQLVAKLGDLGLSKV